LYVAAIVRKSLYLSNSLVGNTFTSLQEHLLLDVDSFSKNEDKIMSAVGTHAKKDNNILTFFS